MAENRNRCDAMLRQDLFMTTMKYGRPAFRVDIGEEPLACLGVPPSYITEGLVTNNVDPNSEFGKLDRPAKLPGKLRIQLEDEGRQAIIEKFWTGNCLFFLVDPEETWIQLGRHAIDLSDDVLMPPVRETPFCVLAFASDGERFGALTLRCVRPNANQMIFFRHGSINYPTRLGLDETQRTTLVLRVLHQFVRQYGWHLGPDISALFFNLLQEQYTSKKMKMENLDLYTLKADLEHNFYPNHIVATGVTIVGAGEALETLGRFEDAARLYIEVARQYQSGYINEFQTYVNAGLAFKRAKKYDQALEWYAKALVTLDLHNNGEWNFQAEHENSVISNLFMLHNEAHKYYFMRAGKGADIFIANGAEQLLPSLARLLDLAGFHSRINEVQFFLKKAVAGTSKEMLKPKLRKPKFAKQMLIDMFKTGCPNKHKEALFSTFRSCDFLMFKGSGFGDHAEETPKEAARYAQGFVKRKIYTEEGQLVPCGSCKKMESKAKTFQICRCQLILYCSKACQNKHWDDHKNNCTWWLKHSNVHCGCCQEPELEPKSFIHCKCNTINYCSLKCKENHRNTHRYKCLAWPSCGSCKEMAQDPTKFHSCPCKTIYYCSKECQTSHWKAHKSTCPWHLKKKQTENAN